MTTCADHTPAPEGYLQWHSWAQRMSTTHRQITCDECNRWMIWVPKRLAPWRANRDVQSRAY